MKKINLNSADVSFCRLVPSNKIRYSSMHSHKWYPFIDHLLQAVTRRVMTDNEFYIDLAFKDGEKGNHFIETFDQMNSNSPCNSILPIVGGVGNGKTSFLKWWTNKNAVINTKCNAGTSEDAEGKYKKYNLKSRININSAECREWMSDGKPFAWHIRNKIVRDLDPLFQCPDFMVNFKKKINAISTPYTRNIETFEMEFVQQSDNFIENNPRFGYELLLACIISAASDTFERPIWIIFDNIDLESIDSQTYYIREAISIYQNTVDLSNNYSWGKIYFHNVLTLRDETFSWHGYLDKYYYLNYPTPQMLSIAKRKLYNALDRETHLHFRAELTIGSLKIETASELNSHIKTNIDEATDFVRMKKYWSGGDENSWHNSMSGNNVRRFVNYWCAFITSGNFLDVCGFSAYPSQQQPSIFKYTRKLFRGQCNEFPGNKYIDDSCKNKKSTFVFNLFESPINHVDSGNDMYIRHYLINVRILQRLYAYEDNGVYYKHLIKDLGEFFDEDIIDSSLKNLLWSRLITEINEGARNISTEKKGEIEFTKRTTLACTNTTKLYIDVLLNNFEYLSTMSLVSWQFENKYNMDIDGARGELHKNATALLAFLDSMREIMLINFNEYCENGTWSKFEELFFLPHHRTRPWMSGITNCHNALKVIARKYPNINHIVSDYKHLRIEGKNQFSNYIDYKKYDLGIRDL